MVEGQGTDRNTGGETKFAQGLRRRLALARLALFWEQAWPALWPAAGSLGMFIALSLAGIWQLIEGWYHLTGLALFAIVTLALLWRGLRTLHIPDRNEGRGRLEAASGLDHRPLAALSDTLASGRHDGQTRALWQAYRRRVLKSLSVVRIGWPQTKLAARDPRGLRAIVVLALFVGGMAAGSDAPTRMLAAFTPNLLGEVPPARLEAWITPPAYTARPPILLSTPTPQKPDDPARPPAKPAMKPAMKPAWVAVPAGSTLFARLHGGRGAPTLQYARTPAAFEAVDVHNHQINQILTKSGLVSVVQNKAALAAWQIGVTPDNAPVAAFADLPTPTARLALKIAYLATDDYGVTGLSIEIQGPNADIEEIELAVPRQKAATFRNSTYRNFTPHRWAGLNVFMTLVAKDAVGNIGRSDTIRVALPERNFEHPVARAIIEQRKKLASDWGSGALVSRALEIIGSFPEEFDHDFVVKLALRTSSRRLILSPTEQSIGEVIDMLWATALRIEDGAISVAEANLRNAEQALMDALDRGADEKEIARLSEQLRQAMERFLQALAEEALRDAQAGKTAELPLDPNARILRSEDLQKMLERAQELARLGAKDAARELLSQLREMLENLRAGRKTARMSPQMREGQRALKEMGELMRRQQELLDRTFRQSRQSLHQNGEGQKGGKAPSAAEQEALRRALGDIMRRLGEGRGKIPGPLGKAERAMRGAGESLAQGRPGEAVPSQGRALDQMRAGVEQLARSMMAERGRGGTMVRRPPGQGQRRTDPLGRPLDGTGTNTTPGKKVPGQAAIRRAREVLEELHKRAAEPMRPAPELRYIDRLLRRF